MTAHMSMDLGIDLPKVPVNHIALVDSTDFVTIKTTIAYNAAGLTLVWNFTTTAGVTTQTAVTPTSSGVHDWLHSGNGMYTMEIPAAGGTINNTVAGFGWFSGKADGVLPFSGPIILFRDPLKNDADVDVAGAPGVHVVSMGNDTITANAFDESTAFPLKSADAGGTSLARAGADSDTLKTLSDQLDPVGTNTTAIKAKTDNLPASPAAVGSAMTLAAGAVNLTSTSAALIDELVSRIWTDSLAAYSSEPGSTAEALAAAGGAIGTALSDIMDVLTSTGVVLDSTAVASLVSDILTTGIDGAIEDAADPYSLAGAILNSFFAAAGGSTLTVYKTDGVSAFLSLPIVRDNTAEPIITIGV